MSKGSNLLLYFHGLNYLQCRKIKISQIQKFTRISVSPRPSDKLKIILYNSLWAEIDTFDMLNIMQTH